MGIRKMKNRLCILQTCFTGKIFTYMGIFCCLIFNWVLFSFELTNTLSHDNPLNMMLNNSTPSMWSNVVPRPKFTPKITCVDSVYYIFNDLKYQLSKEKWYLWQFLWTCHLSSQQFLISEKLFPLMTYCIMPKTPGINSIIYINSSVPFIYTIC